MREPVNRILSIIAGVRRQALLCLSTSSAERGPAGAAGELQGHTPEGVGTKKCVGIPIRDRHPLPFSRQMGEKMCEIEDVEQAFVCYMHDRTIDGQPRTSRATVHMRPVTLAS
jgi:hypothetical protein